MHRRRVLGQMSREETGVAGEGEPGGNPGPLDTDADRLGRFLGRLWAQGVAKKEAQACWRAISDSEGGWSTRALAAWVTEFQSFEEPASCPPLASVVGSSAEFSKNPVHQSCFPSKISDGSKVLNTLQPNPGLLVGARPWRWKSRPSDG